MQMVEKNDNKGPFVFHTKKMDAKGKMLDDRYGRRFDSIEDARICLHKAYEAISSTEGLAVVSHGPEALSYIIVKDHVKVFLGIVMDRDDRADMSNQFIG
jgi:hypothetical protein